MAITAINHLAFITPDMEKTIRFYSDLLGFRLEAGVGHGGYRHYFFAFGDNQVAFFEYEGAAVMERKFHGVKTDKPLGFDHVSFTVPSVAELFRFKDKLDAAGIEVTGPIDHGPIWSIYFFDNNTIPLEISADVMEVLESPAMSDDDPMGIVAEGADPQPGIWPEVARPTPRSEWKAKPGNGFEMRPTFLREGKGRIKPEYEDLIAASDAEREG